MFWKTKKSPARLRYVFSPKEDISAYAVALLIQVLFKRAFGAEISASSLPGMPEALRQHFIDLEKEG